MPKILGGSLPTISRRAVETEKNIYFDGKQYTKDKMIERLFVNYGDQGLDKTFSFKNLMAPYAEQSYTNGIKSNTYLTDSENSSISYVINLRANTGNNSYQSTAYLTISTYFEKEGMINQFYEIPKFYSSYYWRLASGIEILGQSKDWIYVSLRCGQSYSYTSSSPKDTSNNLYGFDYIGGYIFAISKKNKSQDKYYSNYGGSEYKNIFTYKLGTGIIRKIKETDDRIYFITNNAKSQYNINNYTIFYIDKNKQTTTIVKEFDLIYSGTIYSNGIAPSEVLEISENVYEIYVGGLTTTSDNYISIYKATIKLNESEPTQTTVDINKINFGSDVPFFGDSYEYNNTTYYNSTFFYSRFFNQLHIFESNGKKYLMTSTNAYLSNDTNKVYFNEKSNMADFKLISLYLLGNTDVDPETEITVTLKDSLTVSQLDPQFFGMLYNTELKNFYGILGNGFFVLNVDFTREKFSLYKDTNYMPVCIGIDSFGNNWYLTQDNEVYLFSENKAVDVVTEIKEDISSLPPREEGTPIELTLLADAYKYNGERMALKLIHKIQGDAVFNDNQAKVLTLETLTTGTQEIKITWNKGSELYIYTDIEKPKL